MVRYLIRTTCARYRSPMASFSRFLRFLLPIALLLAAAIVVPLKLFSSQGLERVERLEQELQVLKENNRQLARENQTLLSEIRAFHSNPGYIEKVARDELGMVGPNEIIYQFPDEEKPKKR